MTEQHSRLRQFFVGLPDACGVPSGLAKIEGEANGGRFDLEKADPNSVFRQKQGQSTRHRMLPAYVAWSEFADSEALGYAIDLMVYAADCYGLNKEGLEHPQHIKDAQARLEFEEATHPQIKALLTVEEASTLSNWS